MATKSKKFNRSIIIKVIAFILALVCVAVATVDIYSFVMQAENSGLYNDIYNIVTTDAIYTIGTTRFQDETENFVICSLNKATLFKSDTQKAFADYTNKAKEKYIQNILQTVINESNTKTPYYTFALLESSYIGLKKIDGHTHVSDDDDYHYYFIDGKGYMDEDPSFIFDENGNIFFETPPVYSDVHTSYDYNYWVENNRKISEYNGISYYDIPSRILKAGTADAVTEICDVYYGSDSIKNHTPFDGYYAVTINRDVIENENISDLIELNLKFDYYVDNFFEFSRLVKENDKQLAKYKNMYFAFLDKNSGTVVSTIPGTENIGEKYKDVSDIDAKLRNKIRKYGYAIIDYPIESHEDDFGQFGLIAANAFNRFYSAADKNVTYYICFDRSFESGNDVFSDMNMDYGYLYAIYQDCRLTCLICLAGFLLCLLILIIKSGRKSYDDELHMMPLDHIFTDFRLIINAFLFILPLYTLDNVYYFYGRSMWDFEVAAITVYMAAVFIDFVLFVSRHIKNHSLFKKVFIVWVVTKVFNALKKLRQERQSQPAKYKDFMRQVTKKIALWVILPNVVLGLLDIILFYGDGLFFMGLLIIFCYDLIVLLKIVKNAAYIRKIFDAMHSIRMGNNDIRINPFELPNYLRAYADDLNNVNDGFKNAVENAIKEQKTKTELITNVSHDLKTPLTSIITYTDLLSRCEIKDETALKYIDILCDKSERLKKLIEDLIEASKASSGTINVEIVKMSLNELVYQVFAEYETEFEKRNLTPIIELSEKEIYVNADSKLAFRTLDNLFGNVKKYAMPGTRVYIKTFTENAKAYVTIQNVSESQLNISAEELMTRFVRGDESRNSDGNGLGLSIAESFSKLQNGELTIEINGDLFTARVEYEKTEI